MHSLRSFRWVLVLPALIVAAESHAAPAADEVLQLAEDAGRWVYEQGQAQTVGMAWPADANKPEEIAFSLSSGTAGVVTYYLALHAATGDARYLDYAAQGGEYLASLLNDAESFGAESRRASLYSGIAGVGVALQLLAEHRAEFASDVEKVVAILADWSKTEPTGIRWSDDFNDVLFGEAGTILFLAWYADKSGDEQALQLATSASQFLLAQAQSADQGRYWLFRRTKPFNLPGFSHGTAGIAYVLGTVGALTDDAELLAAASDGFDYLDSIAEVDGDSVRIPYGWPAENWEGLYEFGWAHGLVGSDAFFTRVQQLGIKEREAARYNALIVNTLASIGLPGTPQEPFAEPSTPMDWRFGRASVLSLLSDYGEGLATRDAIWSEIAKQAYRDERQAHWQVDAPAFMGGGRAAYTGVFHGAAGIGLALLRMHAAMTEQSPYVTTPDDPFAWASE